MENQRKKFNNSQKHNYEKQVNKLFNGNLYHHLIMNGRAPDDHDILNSITNASSQHAQETAKTNDFRPQTANFTITPNNTTLTITRSLNLLTDIGKQDLFKYRADFNETAILCGWSEETKKDVLHAITSAELTPLYRGIETTNDKFYALLRRKYPPEDANSYYNKLNNIRQNDYATIELYHSDIKYICERLSICKDWNQNMCNQKIQEALFNGLTNRTKLEMSRLNIRNIEEMYNLINTTEKTMIEQMSTRKPQIKKEKSYRQVNQQNMPQITSRNKYCTFHHSKTHSTEECRMKDRSEEGKYGNKKQYESKSLALNEPNAPKNSLEMQGKLINTNVQIIIDTGSAYNYINKAIVRKLNLMTEEIENKTMIMANGDMAKCNEQTKIELMLSNDKNVIHLCNTRIMDSLTTDIILGMEFLENNNAIIDLKDGIITIDGRQYELEKEKHKFDSNDQILCEKTKVLVCSDIKNQRRCDIIRQFTRISEKLGTIDTITHAIETTNNIPVRCKPYRVPIKINDTVYSEIKKLQSMGIIRPSNSEYCSPAFPIHKKNGKIRIVVDYRKINNITVPLNFPLPRIQDILQDLAGNTIFSQIDLNMGYYQIPMHPKDIKKTSFSLCGKQFEFLRMPFGLCNAPRTFQRAMTEIFQDVEFVKIYLDDILVHSKCQTTHEEHLLKVYSILKDNNITVNIEKSSFFKDEVTYLGFKISKDGIKPDVTRVQNYEYKPPKTHKQLQRILGLINWFRPFVNKLSTRISSIYNKLSVKENQFKWNGEDHTIIKEIFDEIKKETLLNYPQFNKPFLLEVDACNEGIGSILYQEGKIIGFFSYKFRKSEINYSTVEKETFAIIKSMQHFKNIIFNSNITIRSDNKNLLTPSDLSSRIQRWKLQLEEFNYELEHLEGKLNRGADIISRTLMIKENQITEEPSPLTDIFEGKNANITNKNVLDLNNTKTIIKQIHVRLGHPGCYKLFCTIKRYLKTKSLYKICKNITSQCITCQRSKHNNVKYGNVNGTINSTIPLKKIAIDIMGPLKTKFFTVENNHANLTDRYFYILVMTDIYSRWTEVSFLKNTKSETIIKEIKDKWINKFGTPESILSDQGRQFISINFKNFLQINKINQILTSPYNPTGNSIVERINYNIGNILRITKGNTLNMLHKNIFSNLNFTVNRNNGLSPYEILYMQDPFNLKIKIEPKFIKERLMNEIKIKMSENNKRNKKRVRMHYQRDNFVFIKNHSPDKIEDKWKGPFKIISVSNCKNRLLIDEKKKQTWNNIKNVRPFLLGTGVEYRDNQDKK